MGWYQGGHVVLMGFWWLMVILLAIMLVYGLVRIARMPETGRRLESPEQILKRRFASGEIDATTYERMLHDIRG
jgi:putative membrane protein